MRRSLAIVAFLAVVGVLTHLFTNSRPNGTVRSSFRSRASATKEPEPSSWIRDRAPDPAGTLTLEGQVVIGDNQPVPRAVVIVDSMPQQRVLTEEDGTFVIAGLLPRRYHVAATKDQWVATPRPVVLTEFSEPMLIRLQNGISLAVKVIDAQTGTPLNADVELRQAAVRTGRTGSDGRVTLVGAAPGMGILRVSSTDRATAWRTVDVAVANSDPIEVAMAPGVKMIGRVVDENGLAVIGAQVLALEALASVAAASDPALTDETGRFAIDSLDSARRYRFIGRHPQYGEGDFVGTLTSNVVVVLHPRVTLLGHVVDPHGMPVAGATIRAMPVEGRLNSPREVTSDERGQFQVVGLEPGPTRLLAMHHAGASLPITIVLDSRTASVKLKLEARESISGTVESVNGQPLANALVLAEPDQATLMQMSFDLRDDLSAVTDELGRFAFDALPTGAYLLAARRAEAIGDDFGPRKKVASGAHDVRIILQEVGTAVGQVRFEDGGIPRSFSIELNFNRVFTMRGSDGAFTLGGMQPGSHALRIRGSDFEPQDSSVEIRAGTTSDVGTITVHRTRIITGRVVGEGGQPAPGATVKIANLIVASGEGISGPVEGSRALSIHTGRTGNNGRFEITGVARTPMVAVAEHSQLGRSVAIPVPAEHDTIEQDLVLRAPGAIHGILSRDRRGLSNASVVAHSLQEPRARFASVTEPDGSYRLDRLAPGDYVVTGGMNTPGGGDFRIKRTEVRSGADVKLDLELSGGTATLVLEPDYDAETRNAQVYVVNGELSADNGRNLEESLAARSSGYSRITMMLGAPITLSRLTPDVYTVCALPLPKDLSDRVAMQRVLADPGALPARCERVSIKEGTTQVALLGKSK